MICVLDTVFAGVKEISLSCGRRELQRDAFSGDSRMPRIFASALAISAAGGRAAYVLGLSYRYKSFAWGPLVKSPVS